MAEAHSAVAFSFQVTHEGVLINYDLELLNVVWLSGVRSWKKRFSRFFNNFKNGIYPSSIEFLLFIILFMICFRFVFAIDISFGIIKAMNNHLLNENDILATILFGILIWLLKMLLMRYSLKLLLMYKGWMFESRIDNRQPNNRIKISLKTKIWIFLIKFLTSRSKTLLYSYQTSLPRLPLPSLNDTIERYLLSIKPLYDEKKYSEIERLAIGFKNGIGKKLQMYLWLKSWWSTNYVSDWWEEFVYLRNRQSLMVNSNYYGIDAFVNVTDKQTSRAGNLIYACLLFRQQIDRQLLKPILVQNLVPLCSRQYERIFNTIRTPGRETDSLRHFNDSEHVIIFYKNNFYKLIIHSKGKLLKPKQIEYLLDKIVTNNNDDDQMTNYEYLSSLTAIDRLKWAEIREKHFSSGTNQKSLCQIEKAAFIVILHDDDFHFDSEANLNKFGQFLLHGNGKSIWFDKSFNLIVANNGKVGFNAEHSWADAPIMAHLWEFILNYDCLTFGYDDKGKCMNIGNSNGEDYMSLNFPQKLKFEINDGLAQEMKQSYQFAQSILSDVDLFIYKHDEFGKGLMKKCRLSPDAFIQMALQLAYYKDIGHLSLTYEASMTRLFREGRTETVRPVTIESSRFVRSMRDPNATNDERLSLLREACIRHQKSYQNAMCGRGVDRHLFCLYVVSKYLEVDEPFLKQVLSEPWKLSTSQTPHGQMGKVEANPKYISAGGGFGPVADDGYGVSYIIAGDDVIFFHISSKISSSKTNSKRFAHNICQSLIDIRSLFQ